MIIVLKALIYIYAYSLGPYLVGELIWHYMSRDISKQSTAGCLTAALKQSTGTEVEQGEIPWRDTNVLPNSD